MKRSFDNSSLSAVASSSFPADDRAMDIDEPNAYQVAMKKVTLVDRPPPPADCALLAARQSSRHKHEAADIVAMANQITQADAAVRHQAAAKLSLLYDQLQYLQRQSQEATAAITLEAGSPLADGVEDRLVAMASAISTAQATSQASDASGAQVALIGQQIGFLHAQARRVLDETATAQRLNAAACNFRKLPGTVYHLYRRDSGQTYLSMLSPAEWGMGLPHVFQGSWRLEADASWTPVDRLAEVTRRSEWAGRLLAAAAMEVDGGGGVAVSEELLAIE